MGMKISFVFHRLLLFLLFAVNVVVWNKSTFLKTSIVCHQNCMLPVYLAGHQQSCGFLVMSISQAPSNENILGNNSCTEFVQLQC